MTIALSLDQSRVGAALARARTGLSRLGPVEARGAQEAGALLVDTRTDSQRECQGDLPGVVVIDRTVLEWRLDPTSEHCIPEARARPSVIVICRQGYSSSFAAADLRRLGVDATDVIDGVEGWIRAGLPLFDGRPDVRG
ncbi:rhodanese-like domain-containing protein [Nocardioides sp.]|uniref:rhodanese-like domain-containing protein n=1 Tax=Nocardioides sp. TaxID=35761 RepID=UPI00344B5D75